MFISSQEPLGQFQPKLTHPWVKGIPVWSNKGSRPFPKWDAYEKAKKKHWQNLRKQFHPNMAQRIHVWSGFKFVQMKYHAPSKRRWLRIEIAKINWQNLKIFLLRTPRSIATKLVTKFPWVVGIQVYSIKWTRPFPRGDNFEIAKILWRNKKKFSRTTEPISTKLCTKHPFVQGTHGFTNKDHSFIKNEMIGFFSTPKQC